MAITWKNMGLPQFNNSAGANANAGFGIAIKGGEALSKNAQQVRDNLTEQANNEMMAQMAQARTPEDVMRLRAQLSQDPNKWADMGKFVNNANAMGMHFDTLQNSETSRANTAQQMRHAEQKLPGELEQLDAGNALTRQTTAFGAENQEHTRKTRKEAEKLKNETTRGNEYVNNLRESLFNEALMNAPEHYTPEEKQLWAAGQAEDGMVKANAGHQIRNALLGEGGISQEAYDATNWGQMQKAVDDKFLENMELQNKEHKEYAEEAAGVWSNVGQGFGFKQMGIGKDGQFKPLTAAEARDQSIGSDGAFQNVVAIATGGKDGGFKFDFSEIKDKGLKARMKSMYGDMSRTMVAQISKNIQKAGAKNSTEFSKAFVQEALGMMQDISEQGKQFGAPVEQQTNTLGLAAQGVKNNLAAAGNQTGTDTDQPTTSEKGDTNQVTPSRDRATNIDLSERLDQLGYEGDVVNKQLPMFLKTKINNLLSALDSGQTGSGRSKKVLSEAEKEQKAKELDEALERARTWRPPARNSRVGTRR